MVKVSPVQISAGSGRRSSLDLNEKASKQAAAVAASRPPESSYRSALQAALMGGAPVEDTTQPPAANKARGSSKVRGSSKGRGRPPRAN